MQVCAIPTGPTYYQPIQPARAVAPVQRQDADADGNAEKARPTPPAGVGGLLDIKV